MYKNEIQLIKNNTTFYLIQQVEANLYDLDVTSAATTCDNIWEKTQFIYSLWHEIKYSIENYRNQFSASLLKELSEFFSKYDEPDLAYWNFIGYESLNPDTTDAFDIYFNSELLKYVLTNDEITLLVPIENDYLCGIDKDGSDIEVEENNCSEIAEAYIYMGSDSEWLFMSEDQIKEGDICLDKFIGEIIAIFNKNRIPVTNCHQLAAAVFNV
jgi:hypothetical protein